MCNRKFEMYVARPRGLSQCRDMNCLRVCNELVTHLYSIVFMVFALLVAPFDKHISTSIRNWKVRLVDCSADIRMWRDYMPWTNSAPFQCSS